MSVVVNEPVIRALLKRERKARKEVKLHLSPRERISEEEQVLIDIAFNNAVAEESVLPLQYEKSLMLATANYYHVSKTKANPKYDTGLMVTFDTASNRIQLFLHHKPTDTITLKQFTVMVPEVNEVFITTNISKTMYLEHATRLKKEKVYQYGEDLAGLYKILFHVVFQTDSPSITNPERLEELLVDLLNDTEVTLHLNITRTVKLYGGVDDEKFLNIYVREIGTPDTYWSRAVLITELANQF